MSSAKLRPLYLCIMPLKTNNAIHKCQELAVMETSSKSKDPWRANSIIICPRVAISSQWYYINTRGEISLDLVGHIWFTLSGQRTLNATIAILPYIQKNMCNSINGNVAADSLVQSSANGGVIIDKSWLKLIQQEHNIRCFYIAASNVFFLRLIHFILQTRASLDDIPREGRS